jgi:hypothetical protein
MERLVRIRDLKTSPGHSTFLDLPDLLPLLEPDAHAWLWAMQTVPWITANEGWDFNLPVLERDIAAGRRGLALSFEELIRLGQRVNQVIWGEFVAAERSSGIVLASDDAATVGRRAHAGLAAIDSTYWLVGGPAAVVARFEARFAEVDVLDPSEWIRGED